MAGGSPQGGHGGDGAGFREESGPFPDVRGAAARHRGGMDNEHTNPLDSQPTSRPTNPYADPASYPNPSVGEAPRAALGTATAPRRLTRSRADKMVAGVCGGAAHYAGIDPVLMRLLFVAATVFTGGAGILLYIAGWFLMPQD